MTADAFTEWFEALTGNKWPLATPPGLVQVARFHWETEDATKQAFPNGWLTPCAPATSHDFTVVANAGHGVNSYAAYFIRQAGHHFAFLRLPFGGVHMDYEECGAAVALAISRYHAFVTEGLPGDSRSTVICNMGEWSAKLELNDGVTDRPFTLEVAADDDEELFSGLARRMRPG